jgi:hypothetical protein
MLVMALTGGSTLPLVTGVLGEGYGMRASLLIVPAALLVQACCSCWCCAGAALRPQ